MKSENRSQAFLRKRKTMLVLPLLVIPFLTMAFWALGGGSGATAKASAQGKGLNLNLPQANLKENEDEGKLSFYDRAQKDSAKRKEWMESDPYYKNLPDSAFEPPAVLPDNPSHIEKYKQLSTTPFSPNTQQPEEKLMQKIAALQKELNKPSGKVASETASKNEPPADNFPRQTQELQNMIADGSSSNSEDPEIQQLSTTLDKILDIQHPDRVKERLKEKSIQQKKQVFAVSDYKPVAEISVLGNYNDKENSQTMSKSFFGEKGGVSETETNANAVPAVVQKTQALASGSTVKLRLMSDVFVGGKKVPRGTFVYGVGSLEGERLLISIPSIRFGNDLLPVSLSVYDLDGLAGIHVPGAMTNEVAKQSVEQSVGNIGLLSMDPSLKAQAASEGIKAAKSLLSKKVKQVNVTLKAGYRVLLRDGNGEE